MCFRPVAAPRVFQTVPVACASPPISALLFVSYLGEANVVGLLTEALTADVEAVLADETSRVGADTAKQRRKIARLAAILQISVKIRT